MNAFLAIDIGTSSAKLSAFAQDGALLISRSSGYAVDAPRAGWAEQDPEAWWDAVCVLAPQIMAGLAGHTLTAIAVSGQTPLCVPVDAEGRPLRKAILWLDRRATAQVDWMATRLGDERCREVGLNRIDSYFGGAKWLWYLQSEPERFARTWKIMQANGFVSFRLSGQAVIDPSQAGLCSPCFNLDAGVWDSAICEEMGLPIGILPEIRASHAVIGTVLPAAALATGLPVGTPVVCGGGDFACACLGAGVAGPGRAALMLGTAGNLMLPGVDNPDPRLLHTRHVTGESLTFGGVMAGGNLTWFASLFDGASDFHARADREAADIPPGSEGLLYLPYLAGERTPIWDPDARGAFVGLTNRHSRAHMYRAVLEGVAFAFRQISEISGSHGLTSLVAIDGGARSALWRAIFASMLGVPVHSGSERAGTGLGAAFLAALGVGAVASAADISRWVQIEQETLPDATTARRYDELYPAYEGLYGALQPAIRVLCAGSGGA